MHLAAGRVRGSGRALDYAPHVLPIRHKPPKILYSKKFYIEKFYVKNSTASYTEILKSQEDIGKNRILFIEEAYRNFKKPKGYWKKSYFIYRRSLPEF